MLPHLWSGYEGERQNEVSKNLFNKTVNFFLSHVHLCLAASLVLINILCDVTPPARAQSPTSSAEWRQNFARLDGSGSEARIQILTRPIGATVWLNGEYSMTGCTPYTITHFLKGRYRIRATKLGYENWEKDYVFNGQGDDKLTIKLAPKTRFKALWRSLYFPGSGQVYGDHPTWGYAISLMQFSTASVLLYRQVKYNTALDDYNTALKNFQASQKVQDRQADLIAQVVARKTNLDDAYAIRKRWLIIAGAIYAYNLLDAVVFFPAYQHGSAEISVSLDQNSGVNGKVIGFNVQAKF